MITGAVVCFCFMDGRTPRVNIMTTYSAEAWWVNNRIILIELNFTNFIPPECLSFEISILGR